VGIGNGDFIFYFYDHVFDHFNFLTDSHELTFVQVGRGGYL
jgi:hypothetical protein